MGLVPDLRVRMESWENKMVRKTPTVPGLKRAWTENRFAQMVFLAGMKKGMEAAYASVRHAWRDGVLNAGDYQVGTGGKNEGIWFITIVQDNGILAARRAIPLSSRIASYWNAGQLWEAIYLAGQREGWRLAHEFLWDADGGDFRQVWVVRRGFPD